MDVTPQYPYWPEALGAPGLDSLTKSKPSNTTSVTPQNKTKIVRKVSSRIQRPVSLEFYFTAEQLEIFEDFFDNTLNGGVNLFWFLDPVKKSYQIAGFDPSQETAYTENTNGSIEYFVVVCKFLYWD